MEKTDIRVRYTRKVLRDSLVALMEKKSILNITIKEICDLSRLSRSTFYTYYKDQYDLLRELEEDIMIDFDKLHESFKKAVRLTKRPEPSVVIQNLLQYIINNSNSIQVLLSENGDSAFQKKFFNKGIEGFRQISEAVGAKHKNEQMNKYFSFFMLGGFITVVQEWLKNGMDTPVSEMAMMFVKIAEGAQREGGST